MGVGGSGLDKGRFHSSEAPPGRMGSSLRFCSHLTLSFPTYELDTFTVPFSWGSSQSLKG